MVGYGIAYNYASFQNLSKRPDAQGAIMVNYRLMTAYTLQALGAVSKFWKQCYKFFSKLSFLTDKMYIITDRLPMFIIDLALH